MKQIYENHKKNWWAQMNASEHMTQDDFLQLQDIAYLDQKHKKGTWCLHKTWHFPSNHGLCSS